LQDMICQGCWERDPDERPESFQVVEALHNASDPIIPGVGHDFEECPDRVLAETVRSPEAVAAFDAPPLDAEVEERLAELGAGGRGRRSRNGGDGAVPEQGRRGT